MPGPYRTLEAVLAPEAVTIAIALLGSPGLPPAVKLTAGLERFGPRWLMQDAIRSRTEDFPDALV